MNPNVIERNRQLTEAVKNFQDALAEQIRNDLASWGFNAMVTPVNEPDPSAIDNRIQFQIESDGKVFDLETNSRLRVVNRMENGKIIPILSLDNNKLEIITLQDNWRIVWLPFTKENVQSALA